LIVAAQQFLSPLVQPRYRIAIERRTYLALLTTDEYLFAGKPDVLIVSPVKETFSNTVLSTTKAAVTAGVMPQVVELPMPEEVVERYLEVRDVMSGDVITVIEILSPTNKLTRQGREKYEQKRFQVLSSSTHLVEVDLLRAGRPFPLRVQNNGSHSHYRIIISRAQQRPLAEAYFFSVRDPIPDTPIPLRPEETELILPLNQLLHELYDRARYDLAIDYQQPSDPRLSDEDAARVKQLLQ
jgi:hypothetical protein